MKKKTVIVSVCVLLLIGIAAGLLLLKNALGKRYDFVLRSVDNTSSIEFEGVCKTNPEKNMGDVAYKAQLADEDSFYEEHVRNNPAFLYSVDDRNAAADTETGKYLFFKDDHYYYITVENGNIYGAELSAVVYYENSEYDFDTLFTLMPFIGKTHIGGGFGSISKEPVELDLNMVPGVNSFEELTAFYGRVKGIDCTVDDEMKTITLPLFDGRISYEDNCPAWDKTHIEGKLIIEVNNDMAKILPVVGNE